MGVQVRQARWCTWRARVSWGPVFACGLLGTGCATGPGSPAILAPALGRFQDPVPAPQEPPPLPEVAAQEPAEPAIPPAGSGAPLADSAPAPEASPALPAAQAGLPIHGYVRARGRYRTTTNDDDLDVDATISLDIGDRERNPVTGHVLAWSNLDIGSEGSGDPFFDLTDTYSDAVTLRLYQAFADVHTVEELDLLRLGRQPLDETPEFVSFDGVRVELAERGALDVRTGLYGGIPVHLYESSTDGDAVLGAFAEARPWEGGRARFDWMHLEDEDILAEHTNDLFELGLWQAAGKRLRLEGHYSRLEQENRDARIQARWFDPEQELTVQASWYELLETQKDLATEVDPFYEALLEYFPFYQARLQLAKGFAERYQVEAGAELRRLREASDEGEFNREFERYHARASVADLGTPGLTLGLTGELWNDGAEDIQSWAADLTKEWAERWRASLGSYYALYDVDLFSVAERDHVRVYFLGLRYEWSANASLELDYDFENDDLNEYHVLRMGILWRF